MESSVVGDNHGVSLHVKKFSLCNDIMLIVDTCMGLLHVKGEVESFQMF